MTGSARATAVAHKVSGDEAAKSVNTVWSFFSGAMGLDLGFEAEGLAPSLAVEVEPVFCETVRANRPEVTLVEADVAQLDGESLRRLTGVDDVDLFVGGPPCRGIVRQIIGAFASLAGWLIGLTLLAVLVVILIIVL